MATAQYQAFLGEETAFRVVPQIDGYAIKAAFIVATL